MSLWTQVMRARFRLQITKKSKNPTLQFDRPEINQDEPSAVALCDDLANFASHRVSSLAATEAHN
jgi:hypothetical protein